MEKREIRGMADEIIGDEGKGNAKRELHRIEIEPADNGHIVTAHIKVHAPRRRANEIGPDYEQKRRVFGKSAEAADHVKALLDGGDLE